VKIKNVALLKTERVRRQQVAVSLRATSKFSIRGRTGGQFHPGLLVVAFRVIGHLAGESRHGALGKMVIIAQVDTAPRRRRLLRRRAPTEDLPVCFAFSSPP
jgi:hypothetical protein